MRLTGQKAWKLDSDKARTTAVALLIIGGLAGARADEFTLSSGKVVKGAIVAQTGTEYTLRTELGTIRINKSEVSRMLSQGTTPTEIEGDISASKGDLQTAASMYRQALTEIAGGSEAALRVQQKLDQVSQTKQRAVVGAVAGQFENAQALIKAQKYDAAQIMLDQIAGQISATDPLTTEILKMQAQLHYGQGRAAKDAVKMDVARQEFESAITADPTFYPAYIELGSTMMGSSSTSGRGIDLIEKGLVIAGDRMPEQQRFTYLNILGDKYYEQGNYAKAATAYAQLIGAKDKYPAYGDALDKAVDSYVKMGEENPSGDFQQTITNLNTALKLNPENQKALFLLGRIYLDLGQNENAIITLKKLVAVAPSYQDANNYLGKAYFHSRDYESALGFLSIELSNHPKNYSALIDRAEVHIALGNFTAAEADISLAKSLEPNLWYAYYLGGLKSFKQGDYARAQTALLEALEIKRSAMPIRLLMGRVLMKQNQIDGAKQWFEQVADNLKSVQDLSYRYKGYRAEALTYLGQIALDQKNPRKAAGYLNDALQTMPDFAPALASLGDAAIMLSSDPTSTKPKDILLGDAEKLYTKAINKDPNNPEYYRQLAIYYQRNVVNREKALANFNLYVDKGGKDPRVNSFLTELGGTARPELVTTPTATMSMPVMMPNTMPTSGTMAMPGMMMPPAIAPGMKVTSVTMQFPPVGTQPVITHTSSPQMMMAPPAVAPQTSPEAPPPM